MDKVMLIVCLLKNYLRIEKSENTSHKKRREKNLSNLILYHFDFYTVFPNLTKKNEVNKQEIKHNLIGIEWSHNEQLLVWRFMLFSLYHILFSTNNSLNLFIFVM